MVKRIYHDERSVKKIKNKADRKQDKVHAGKIHTEKIIVQEQDQST